VAVALAVVNHINVAVISHITDVAVVRTWSHVSVAVISHVADAVAVFVTWSHIALLLLFSGLGVT
jgi:hypothetical protein